MPRYSPSPPVRQHCGAGFTVTELLIAVTLIATLAAILLSVFSKAARSSAQTKSTHHLKQMGSALALHAADNNGALVQGAHYPSLNGKRYRFWFDVLDSYMGGVDSTAQEYYPTPRSSATRPSWQNCPLKKFSHPVTFQGWGVGIGYGWNYLHLGYTPPISDETPRMGWGTKLAQITQPAATIVIGTSVDTTDQSDFLQHLLVYSDPGFPHLLSRRFNGRGLYLFADGHIDALTPTEAMQNNGYLFRKK